MWFKVWVWGWGEEEGRGGRRQAGWAGVTEGEGALCEFA